MNGEGSDRKGFDQTQLALFVEYSNGIDMFNHLPLDSTEKDKTYSILQEWTKRHISDFENICKPGDLLGPIFSSMILLLPEDKNIVFSGKRESLDTNDFEYMTILLSEKKMAY